MSSPTSGTGPGLSAGPTHWKCPDCLQPCSCDGPARLLRHVGCGRRPGTELGDVPNTIAARRLAQERAAAELLADPDATEREPERPTRIPA